jgi:hypothetical protein
MTFNINVENVILPDRALNNFELTSAVKKLEISNFKGVFMRNELSGDPDKIECGILNLDDNDNLTDAYGTTSGRGTHWTCWFKKGKNIYYFDSYGLKPPTELTQYLKSPILYNARQVQPAGTIICGHLCLYILKKLSKGSENFENIINDLY